MLVQIGFILGLMGICGVTYGLMEIIQEEHEMKKRKRKNKRV